LKSQDRGIERGILLGDVRWRDLAMLDPSPGDHG
jgi:hypothetical protein